MTIHLCGFKFSGPYANLRALQEKPGVYALLTRQRDGIYRLIDCDAAKNARRAAARIGQPACFVVAVKYPPEHKLERIVERELKPVAMHVRAFLGLPCSTPLRPVRSPHGTKPSAISGSQAAAKNERFRP